MKCLNIFTTPKKQRFILCHTLSMTGKVGPDTGKDKHKFITNGQTVIFYQSTEFPLFFHGQNQLISSISSISSLIEKHLMIYVYLYTTHIQSCSYSFRFPLQYCLKYISIFLGMKAFPRVLTLSEVCATTLKNLSTSRLALN